MKTPVFKEGACFENFDAADESCKICYVSRFCSMKTENKGKKATKCSSSASPVVFNKIYTSVELHKMFINQMNNIFTRMNRTEFGTKGVQHDFFGEKGEHIGLIKTCLSTYKMIVLISKKEAISFDTMKTVEDVNSTILKIKRML